MAEPRCQTRSAGAQRRDQQSDAQFWSNKPDPILIERGQTEAIQLVWNKLNSTTINATGQPTETTMNMFRAPPMVFVDDEGLEEQFLTEDEVSQEIMDVTANRVTTPAEDDAAPLNPIYTQRSQRDEDLDLQPSRGPREESLSNAQDQFLNESYEDVLRMSNIQTNLSISVSNRDLRSQSTLPLGWIVLDGTNRTLEEISDKKISSGISPAGGQAGTIVINLQRLEPYYGTQFFMEMGEVFAYTQQQWRRPGLYCSSQLFSMNELMLNVECHGQAMQVELEAEQQTPLVDTRRTPSQFEAPPPLPTLDQPDIYILQPDAMQTKTRKNYVQDQMRAALIYILEYVETRRMMAENRFRNEDLIAWLRAVFGRVDKIKDQIDRALQQDDAHRK